MIEATPFQVYRKIRDYINRNRVRLETTSTNRAVLGGYSYWGICYGWADLREEDGDLVVDNTYPYDSPCRGWIQEAWACAKTGRIWTNVPGKKFDPSFINTGPTVFLCTTSAGPQLKRAVELMNVLEQKHKWYKSRLIDISNKCYKITVRGEAQDPSEMAKDSYLLVGSRNWKSNFVLISAYLLMAKTMAIYSSKTESLTEVIE